MPCANSSLPTDTSRCPLCGRSNQCAISAGTPADECWCMTSVIAPSALARIPDSMRGQSCLCPACSALPSSAPTAPQAPGTPI